MSSETYIVRDKGRGTIHIGDQRGTGYRAYCGMWSGTRLMIDIRPPIDDLCRKCWHSRQRTGAHHRGRRRG